NAIKDLDQALRLAPNDDNAAMWHSGRGFSYGSLGEWDSAVAAYTEAIARSPGDAELYLMRGGAYSELPNAAAAIEDLSQAVRLAPEMAVAWNNLCWARSVS